jgi:hypothetical protein
MSHRAIDLLPPEIHARNAAGLVMARCIFATIVVALMLVLTITHSQIVKQRARESLRLVMSQADLVRAAEIKESKLKDQLESARKAIDEYRAIALPVDVSRILATVVNLLPHSVTLEGIEIECGDRRVGRTARTPLDARAQEPTPRVLSGELSGFAASDQDIADLVARLKKSPPFDGVSLDFTRSRVVRDRGAREFRLSFRVDLDRTYQVVDASTDPLAQPEPQRPGDQEQP